MAIFVQLVGHKDSSGQNCPYVDKNVKVAIVVQLVAITVQLVDMIYSAGQKTVKVAIFC